ncbi:sulfatase [Robiginitalea sp. SC105]|uniref:sulfatase family protein n=1 Tax=Robiginitalea sp. SC105 TaxID=2762332 RepID=UPI001C8DC28F|nr:sulfatase [Robiginitalea sp. SC105]
MKIRSLLRHSALLLPAIALLGCSRTASDSTIPGSEAGEVPGIAVPDYASLQLPEKPNILWLVAEDLSPYIAAYGDSTVPTPNLDRLAAEGVRYTRLFSPSGVCAPSRAAIALGMYPTRAGAMHMRTGPWWDFYHELQDTVWQGGRRIYEALPPAGTHMHSTLLREAGYYATNHSKQDYQFRAEMTAWDASGDTAHWRNRTNPAQPFFAIFNFGVTHESQIWGRANDSLQVPADLPVKVPPYLPDTPTVRQDLRRLYSNIVLMDRQVGEILSQLEADGLLDETIIFWYTDHGGVLPRSKRTLYDTGLQVPLLVRFPGAQLAGQDDGQLLSFVDFKPTLLSLAGMQPPDGLDGKPWLGRYREPVPREYIHAAADDFDGCCHGRLRAVRDYRYKYIRNYLPEQPWYQPVPYREQMASMRELLELQQAGSLDSIQLQWFGTGQNPEALFDTRADPLELRNLVSDPAHAAKLGELRRELDRWIEDTGDLGMQPEREYLESIWPGGKQPVTSLPTIGESDEGLALDCATEGAAIGYQWVVPGGEPKWAWQPYTGPVSPEPGMELMARAHRIGYVPSKTVRYLPR